MLIRRLVFGLVLALMLAPIALLAANKKSPGQPGPAPTPAGTDTVNTKVVSPNYNRSLVSLTPGPMLSPGSPIEDRTTIAPFPIPGEKSLTARELSKQLNRPREGVTALEPPSPWASRDMMYWTFPPGSYRLIPLPVDTLRFTWPSPSYPKAAHDAGIQGTVLVMTEIMPDGSVGGTKVAESIPALDDAAVLAVKRMRFKPASDQGKRVSVWLGIPVKFTLH